MSGKKKVLVALLILLLFAAVGAGIAYHMTHYVMVEFTFYPKNATYLDLRGKDISVRHFNKLSRRLPECEVLWEVPFQEGKHPSDSDSITITSLAEQDIDRMDYLPELKTVRAEGCKDYLTLLLLEQHRPDLNIRYRVEIGDGTYDRSTSEVTLVGVEAEEVAYLRCLPQLSTICCGYSEPETVMQIRDYCRENGIRFLIDLGGNLLEETAEEAAADSLAEDALALLQFLPQLQTLHLTDPQAPAESLLQLQKDYPNMNISWEREVCGKLCSTLDTEIDLSDVEDLDLDEVAEGMAYFANVGKVFLGKCAIDNETLAAFREEKREEYQVAWTVQLGEKLTARTDDTTFMPVREYVYYFNDEEAYNLRYCEDMVCIDIGHMSIHNIDWVEFMPDLEFLIVAHSQLQYIEPIKHCKKLKYLELDWSPIKDYSPLVECTALEDLNVGNTFADFEPIGKMTWLKNLWMIGCSSGAAYRMSQALPDTKIMYTGSATVANGWRDLDNYFEMRDLLGMYYMSW